MCAASYLLTEEQLWCCICLDIFTDPATLPCGHNFCRSCILQHLNTNPQRQCPMCKEPVDKKHKLGVNTFISEMAVQFRQSAGKQTSNSSHQHAVAPGGLSHDAPAGPKHPSLKYFLLLVLSLTCLTVFFTAYLSFHQRGSSWKTHPLLDSEEEAAGSTCTEHDRPLELYCKKEQIPICKSCAASDHRYHQVVSLEDEYEEKKMVLGKMEAKIQEMLWQRRLKTRELKRSAEQSEETVDAKMADGIRFFAALIQSLERAQVELVRTTEERQRTRRKRVQGFIGELEEEMSELERWSDEVEHLSRCQDHLRFLRSFPSLNAAPHTRDWTDVDVCPVRYDRLTRTVMIRAVNQMTELVSNEMQKLQDEEMKDVRQFAVEVTLDPGTAHPALLLSDDGKQVGCGDVEKLPDDLKRPEPAAHVLAKQSFSCGRFHYDVQVKGKTTWTVGVAQESVKRKEGSELNPENGYWVVRLQAGNQYVALESTPIPLPVDHPPEKVRVFVDYEEGLVSFYDADAALLLYVFTSCSFAEKLHPFLSPGDCDGGGNSDPLIISPASTR